ncbi:hypothetical protein OHB39_09970 [Streptomyces sp. NBC_00047]|uniref:hypothetical protein n=1 Tax=Streptomyces sp. NBC_00047 TaxID=2975627 RepID=UPI0022577830|nr:hypothetical protein [Streptomyces sp. NBC_00047]MCX5607895.1 hypothetical protein [Streptomyces sp. NBC_00047]
MATTTKNKTKTKTVEHRGLALDWAAGHGPVTGALSATTGAYAVATVGTLAHMPPAWALAVGTVGAIGHTASGLRQKLAARTLSSRAASWLLGSGWTTWALATNPLSWTSLGSLAVLGVGMGAAARSVGFYEEARELEAIAEAERQVARELSAERRAIAAEWVDRVQRVCGISLRVLAVEMWPTNTGYTIDAELPPGGTTYDRIARENARLSADARLPHGCTAAASPGIDQGRVLIDVTTVNILAAEIPYPTDYSPLSIHTGIPWGYRTNAEEICAYLREQCALVVGPTGSGKTNMVHVILAGFARAEDMLTWVIDLNAGSAGLPWVRPALQGAPDGKVVRPGIDWLAASHEEAHKMLDAALRIGLYRKRAYQDLMAKANTDLLPISHEIPQIMLVIDEGAEILISTEPAAKQLAKKILEVIRMLRAMGIRTVLTALGATASVLGNMMIRREAKTRVALTGGSTEGMDLSKLFPGARGLRIEQAPDKGTGFMGTPESPAALFGTWRILPMQIRDIVHATSDRHPYLDAISAKAAGPDYARRWDAARTAWINDHQLATAAAAPADEAPSAGRGLNLSAHRNPQPAAPAGDEDALAAEFMRQIDATFATTPEADETPKPPRPGLNLSAHREEENAARQAALTLLIAAGPEGTGASAIARGLERYGTTRQTIVGWLKTWADEGEAVRIGAGTKTRYVHHTHAPESPDSPDED